MTTFIRIVSALYLLFNFSAFGQQVADTTFTFPITQTAYSAGNGPLIYIDAGHNNLHTVEAGFAPFSMLVEKDGYNVRGINTDFSNVDVLNEAEILVIANALHTSNIGNWTLPTPSAFTAREIRTIKNWVKSGGKLLLIADHMPYAGAASDLAKAFGFKFINGFAMTAKTTWPPSIFSFNNEGLLKSFVTEGKNEQEAVESVTSFTGSAFEIPKSAVPVIRFSKEHYSLQPDTAWSFNENTPSKNLEAYYQGALLEFGEGKIAVFGEAAMFTAQIVNGNVKAGFNSEFAPNNAQFVLNLIHWLDGVREYSGSLEESTISENEKSIIQLNRDMETAFLENNFLKVASYYSDDGIMVGNKHEVKGREAIDNYWLGLKDRGISWKLENVELTIYDSIAVQRGISRMKYKYDSEAHLSEVRFTLIWKKINGEWKIAIDHYSLL